MHGQKDSHTGRTDFRGSCHDLPASDFKLSFDGGPKAALVTPSTCGTYTGAATFSSQASPFISDFQASPAFAITSRVGGGACPAGPLPFAPTLTAGSTATEAGAFSGFTQLLTREYSLAA